MAKYVNISTLLLVVASLSISLVVVQSLPLAMTPTPPETSVTTTSTADSLNASPLPNLATPGPHEQLETETPSTNPDRESSPMPVPTDRPTVATPPPPITVENYQQFTLLTRRIKTKSFEASQPAGLLVRYFVAHVGVNTSFPASVCSCFIDERDPEDVVHGHISPDTDFVQRIEEDYHSTVGYLSYTEWITEDASIPSDNDNYLYTVPFGDLRQLLGELKDSLGELIEMIVGDEPSEREGGGEGSGEELEPAGYAECCYDTSYPRQYWMFLELGTLFTQYVLQDIDYLRDVIKD